MNFLTKHSKAFYYTYGILIGILIIACVFYASQYYDIRVLYTFNEKGELSIMSDTTDSLNRTNSYIFSYFANGNSNGLVAATGFAADFNNYSKQVYDFQNLLSSTNDSFILFGILSLVAFAFLLVLSNHSRRIYYLSNLIGGIVLPLLIIVFNVVILVNNLSVMSNFNQNLTLYNIVSLLQGDKQIGYSQMNYTDLSSNFSCNSLTFVLFSVLFIVVICYSIFMAIYAYLKYKATAEERAEIVKKAVANND